MMSMLSRPALRFATATLAVAALATSPAWTPATAADTGTTTSTADAPYRVLVFSKTAGYRHGSIAAGIAAIRELGAANNFTVTATEDQAMFTPRILARYAAVVFLNTTGDVLDARRETAFESYIASGGGFVGI